MKVLVTAASKHGSTAGIAHRIGEVLAANGHEVDVEPPDEVDVASYDAVVLGSTVYAGHWLPEARDLVERAGEELAHRPTWLFSSGPVGEPPKPDEDPVDVASIVEATKARGHHVFAGRIDKSLLTFPEKAIVVALRVRSGDFRDWSEIEAWAEEIVLALGSGA
jgi:menaquinone-dependent protoporphyrinogen oxidase